VKWRTYMALRVGKFHKYFAWILVFTAQIVMLTGFLLLKKKVNGEGATSLTLGISQIIFFLLVTVTAEFFH